MPNKNINETFKDFFEEGLAQDILMCQVHYYVYRTIAENAMQINQLKEGEELKQLVYLQNTSMQMTLVSLSRIFDRKNRNKKFKVRCIETLIEECQNMPVNFPLKIECYPDIKQLSTLTSIDFPSEFITTKSQLISFYHGVLNSEPVQRAIRNLKSVRDKFIVHNEHNPEIEELKTFWNDCSFLQDIAILYQSTIGEIFLNTDYAPLKKIGPNKIDFGISLQLGWVLNFLEKVLGKGNVKVWWE